MELILTEVCEYLNNYFWIKKFVGKFKITNGNINIAGLKDGQYFRIKGSTFNDGVHLYPSSELVDEEFEGAIWAMAVPATVIAVALEIDEWKKKYCTVDSAAMSPFNSESFGVYSYSKDSGSFSWETVSTFVSRLSPYRRLRGLP